MELLVDVGPGVLTAGAISSVSAAIPPARIDLTVKWTIDLSFLRLVVEAQLQNGVGELGAVGPGSRFRRESQDPTSSTLGLYTELQVAGSLHVLLEPALVGLVVPAIGKGRRPDGLVDEQKLDLAWRHFLKLKDVALCGESQRTWQKKESSACWLDGRRQSICHRLPTRGQPLCPPYKFTS